MADIEPTLPYPVPGALEGRDERGRALDETRRLENHYERYHGFTELGAGGIGTVHACVDPNLGRRVALKCLHAHLQDQAEQRIRFVREARVMARIEHPNIVPVHELGTRRDGSVYFTMKRVQGVTLQRILAGLKNREPSYVENYPLSRLLDIFEAVCHAVAFAHSKLVIHRDLKPANILTGAFGEVLLLDWGLAKFLDEPGPTAPDVPGPAAGPEDPLARLDQSDVTQHGAVSGTPLYMSPEQASGRTEAQDARSDLYSLGAILYEILTLEHTVRGTTLDEILADVCHGSIRPPRRARPDRGIPRELDAVCMKALAKARADRYASVLDLAHDLACYRGGRSVSVYRDPLLVRFWKFARRHPVASAAVAAALVAAGVMLASRRIAESLHYHNLMAEADRHREDGTRQWTQKLARWRVLRDHQRINITMDRSPEEIRLEEEIADLHLRGENEYDTATVFYLLATGDREDVRRRRALAEIFANRLEYAMQTANYARAARILDWLRGRFGADFERLAEPESRRLFRRYAHELQGDGHLELTTRPPGAEATVAALKPDAAGLLAAVPAFGPATTPFASALPKGSYLVTLALPDRPVVRYPVLVGHGARIRAEVYLPEHTPEGTVYVPAGPFLAGGRGARYHRRHERTLDGFFLAETEVTFGDYLRYWLATAGGPHHEEDRGLVRLDHRERCFRPAWDDRGDLIPELKRENPVVGVTREAAARYCAWLGEQRGWRCRLPAADEWEKAARGVDGRAYVWGDGYDPTYAFVAENAAARRIHGSWAAPRSFPRDRSVYGAWDLGGNVREYTGTRFPDDSPFYQIKGASASTTRRFLMCAYASDTPVVPSDVGFRYVIELAKP